MSVAVEVDGQAALLASLEAAPRALADLDGALEDAGDDVLGHVKAPRDTGALDASLTSAAGVVSASARHAPFVHYGTRHLRGRPFLTDALAAREAAIVARFTDHLDDVVDTIRGT